MTRTRPGRHTECACYRASPSWRAALLLLAVLAVGCEQSSAPTADTAVKEMLYVDTQTGTAVIAPAASELPALHPTTGTRTLMPGLYCPTCRKWYATPPIEQINRIPGAGNCPQHKTPLTLHGPWPGDAGMP